MRWISKGSVEHELRARIADRPRRLWLLSVLGWMERNGLDYFNEGHAQVNAAEASRSSTSPRAHRDPHPNRRPGGR